ncbi:uncharacterized protein [Panulirus ornatus]|uniref:uncharacterized protein n=1 Tax=Panulirus ornatus TaxID=150431 RepID=UPI003A87961A
MHQLQRQSLKKKQTNQPYTAAPDTPVSTSPGVTTLSPPTSSEHDQPPTETVPTSGPVTNTTNSTDPVTEPSTVASGHTFKKPPLSTGAGTPVASSSESPVSITRFPSNKRPSTLLVSSTVWPPVPTKLPPTNRLQLTTRPTSVTVPSSDTRPPPTTLLSLSTWFPSLSSFTSTKITPSSTPLTRTTTSTPTTLPSSYTEHPSATNSHSVYTSQSITTVPSFTDPTPLYTANASRTVTRPPSNALVNASDIPAFGLLSTWKPTYRPIVKTLQDEEVTGQTLSNPHTADDVSRRPTSSISTDAIPSTSPLHRLSPTTTTTTTIASTDESSTPSGSAAPAPSTSTLTTLPAYWGPSKVPDAATSLPEVIQFVHPVSSAGPRPLENRPEGPTTFTQGQQNIDEYQHAVVYSQHENFGPHDDPSGYEVPWSSPRPNSTILMTTSDHQLIREALEELTKQQQPAPQHQISTSEKPESLVPLTKKIIIDTVSTSTTETGFSGSSTSSDESDVSLSKDADKTQSIVGSTSPWVTSAGALATHGLGGVPTERLPHNNTDAAAPGPVWTITTTSRSIPPETSDDSNLTRPPTLISQSVTSLTREDANATKGTTQRGEMASTASTRPSHEGNDVDDYEYDFYEDDLSQPTTTPVDDTQTAPYVLVKLWDHQDGQLKLVATQRIPSSALDPEGTSPSQGLLEVSQPGPDGGNHPDPQREVPVRPSLQKLMEHYTLRQLLESLLSLSDDQLTDLRQKILQEEEEEVYSSEVTIHRPPHQEHMPDTVSYLELLRQGQPPRPHRPRPLQDQQTQSQQQLEQSQQQLQQSQQKEQSQQQKQQLPQSHQSQQPQHSHHQPPKIQQKQQNQQVQPSQQPQIGHHQLQKGNPKLQHGHPQLQQGHQHLQHGQESPQQSHRPPPLHGHPPQQDVSSLMTSVPATPGVGPQGSPVHTLQSSPFHNFPHYKTRPQATGSEAAHLASSSFEPHPTFPQPKPALPQLHPSPYASLYPLGSGGANLSPLQAVMQPTASSLRPNNIWPISVSPLNLLRLGQSPPRVNPLSLVPDPSSSRPHAPLAASGFLGPYSGPPALLKDRTQDPETPPRAAIAQEHGENNDLFSGLRPEILERLPYVHIQSPAPSREMTGGGHEQGGVPSDERNHEFTPGSVMTAWGHDAQLPRPSPAYQSPLSATHYPGAHQSPVHAHHSIPPVHQSPLPAHQSPLPTHQSPLPNHQSPLPVYQSRLPAHHSPLPTHQSPFPVYQSRLPAHQSPLHAQRSPLPAHQSLLHAQRSPLPAHRSPLPDHQPPLPMLQRHSSLHPSPSTGRPTHNTPTSDHQETQGNTTRGHLSHTQSPLPSANHSTMVHDEPQIPASAANGTLPATPAPKDDFEGYDATRGRTTSATTAAPAHDNDSLSTSTQPTESSGVSGPPPAATSQLSQQPTRDEGANVSHYWQTSDRGKETDLLAHPDHDQPSVPPPAYRGHPSSPTTTETTASTSTTTTPTPSRSGAFGGVGNPVLLGVPISLQHSSNSFAAPSNTPQQQQASQVFGGVGNDALENHPLILGGEFGSSNPGKFVALDTHNPLLTHSVPAAVDTSTGPVLNGRPLGAPQYPGYGGGNPATSHPLSGSNLVGKQPDHLTTFDNLFQGLDVSDPQFSQVMQTLVLESILATDPQLLLNFSDGFLRYRQDAAPTSLLPPDTDALKQVKNVVRNQPWLSGGVPHYNTTLSVDTSTVNYFDSGDDHFNSHPVANDRMGNEDVEISNSSQQYLSSLLRGTTVGFPPTLKQLRQGLRQHLESSLSAEVPPSPPNPTTPSSHNFQHSQSDAGHDLETPQPASNVDRCLKSNWCAIGLALTVAVGATGAMAVPLVIPVFGRRRREMAAGSGDATIHFISSFEPEVHLPAPLMQDVSNSSLEDMESPPRHGMFTTAPGTSQTLDGSHSSTSRPGKNEYDSGNSNPPDTILTVAGIPGARRRSEIQDGMEIGRVILRGIDTYISNEDDSPRASITGADQKAKKAEFIKILQEELIQIHPSLAQLLDTLGKKNVLASPSVSFKQNSKTSKNPKKVDNTK